LKTLLVYLCQNNGAFKGLDKVALPMILSSVQAWLVVAVFVDCMTGYLSPFIVSYCARYNLDSKAPLILDNVPDHPISIEGYADNMQVVFSVCQHHFSLLPCNLWTRELQTSSGFIHS
jgi:hypothetical protein